MGAIDRLRNKIYFSQTNRLSFYERMASLVDSGVRPNDVVKQMLSEYQRRGIKNSQFKLLKVLNKEIQEHNDAISDALIGLVPRNEALIIDSGIRRNRESQAFRVASGLTESMSRIRKGVLSKLTYPFVLYLTALVLFVGGYFLLDGYTKFSEVMTWDLMAQEFYYIGKALSDNALQIALGTLAFLVTLAFCVVYVPRSRRGMDIYRAVRPYADRFPPFNIYQKISAYSFLIALSGQLESGSTPREALENMRMTSSPYLRDHIDRMLERMTSDSPGHAITSTGLMSIDQEMTINMLSQTKDFAETVRLAAVRTMESAESEISKTTNVIALGGWVVSGGALVWAALSQFSVVMNIT